MHLDQENPSMASPRRIIGGAEMRPRSGLMSELKSTNDGSSVLDQVKCLEANVIFLEETVAQTQSRLDPILSFSDERDRGEAPRMLTKSGIAATLSELNIRINDAVYRLKWLNDRVDF